MGVSMDRGTCLTHGGHWILDHQSHRGYRAHDIHSITLQERPRSRGEKSIPRSPVGQDRWLRLIPEGCLSARAFFSHAQGKSVFFLHLAEREGPLKR